MAGRKNKKRNIDFKKRLILCLSRIEENRMRNIDCIIMVKEWYKQYSETDYFISEKYHVKKMTGFVTYISQIGLFRKPDSPENITFKNIEDFIFEFIVEYIYIDEEKLFLETLLDWLMWLCKTSKLINRNDIYINLKKLIPKAIIKKWNEKNKFKASKELILEAKCANVNLNNKDEIIKYFDERAYYDKGFIREFLDPPWPLFYKGTASYLYDWDIID